MSPKTPVLGDQPQRPESRQPTVSNPWGDLLRLDPTEVTRRIEQLPSWLPDQDDDPVWCHPVSLAGLTPDLRWIYRFGDGLQRAIAANDQVIPVGQITHTSQEIFRLDVLGHYLATPDVLCDHEPFFDTDLPVVSRFTDGHFRMHDGTHRLIAAILSRRPTLHAIVIPLRIDPDTRQLVA